MQSNYIVLSILLCLSLCGFGSCQPKVKTPDKVYITVEKLPTLTAEDKKLLEDCPIEEPSILTVEETVRVAKARKASLANCNIDKKAIRGWFDIK